MRALSKDGYGICTYQPAQMGIDPNMFIHNPAIKLFYGFNGQQMVFHKMAHEIHFLIIAFTNTNKINSQNQIFCCDFFGKEWVFNFPYSLDHFAFFLYFYEIHDEIALKNVALNCRGRSVKSYELCF
ncbi:MAG: hypothetical protein V6Z89_08045 [Desulfobacter sp.]